MTPDEAISTRIDGAPRALYGYDVVEFIGEGAGSLIYAVTDPFSSQVYALKHVVVKSDKHVRFVEQLENEFEVAQKISHPKLRRCLHFKVNKPLLRKPTDAGLVMELFDGVATDAKPPTAVAAAVSVFRQTADALAAMHEQGYVHCDLKPNNILVSAAGDVKLIDLGQACPIGTIKKRIQGTPDFIAPEQVRCEPCTVRTDVFNFGATMYWVLTRRKLPTLFTIKKGRNSFLCDEVIAAPHEISPLVPENLSNIVMECVRTNPAKRPADMPELQRRLELVAHSMAHSQGRSTGAVA